MKRLIKGFTMIELLVVIAIIGVLAAAVLSAINPIEQINKGRDTRSRSDAAETVNSVERYYAVQEEFPWNTVVAGTWDPATQPGAPSSPVTTDPDAVMFVGAGANGTDWDWMVILENTDEVKENFVNRVQENFDEYMIIKEANAGTTFFCFLPQSTQFQQEAVARCNDTDPGLPATYLRPDICGATDPSVLGDIELEYICVP